MAESIRIRAIPSARSTAVRPGTPLAFGPLVSTVFVVDDDPEQAELLAAALSVDGRRVRAFSDPLRALDALVVEGTDLLIADLSMPWIDGAQIVETVRRLRPGVPILLVSGYGRGAEVTARYGLQFFRKPIDLGGLRATVEALLPSSLQSPAGPA